MMVSSTAFPSFFSKVAAANLLSVTLCTYICIFTGLFLPIDYCSAEHKAIIPAGETKIYKRDVMRDKGQMESILCRLPYGLHRRIR
jgi:hypothetical protein